MIMIDASWGGVTHARVEAAVFDDGGNIVVAARIGQMIEEKGASHSQTNRTHTASREF